MSQLIRDNEGLVFMVAKKFRHHHPLEDLMQEGKMGLLRAAEIYEPKRAKWSTYAVWWIRHFITRFVQRDAAVFTSNPTRAVGRFGRERRVNIAVRSLDAPIRPDDDVTPLEQLEATETPVDEQLAQHELRQLVRDALDRAGLDARQQAIVRKRLLGGATLEDVGSDLGLSKERTRQLEAKLLPRLKRVLAPVQEAFDA